VTTVNPFPNVRVRAETKAALEAEAERRRKKDGGRWSMDQLLNALLDESASRAKKRGTRK
jgi:hypothetical protein